MRMEIFPRPREMVPGKGSFSLPRGAEIVVSISDEGARPAAGLIAERLQGRVASGEESGGVHIRLRLVEELDLARNLRPDQRVEAYRLEVSGRGIDLAALNSEGLLRGGATLLQTARWEEDRVVIPCAVIHDWPEFRYRCGSDWLINVECNRWAYDRGDGREAFLARIKRKLDFCFAHKINMVWFDGFGWDTERFPGYAALMKECNRYARRLGIKLVFCGYGGGYGTAYQAGEIYRYGYFGRTHLNKRPYPDGEEYACRGWPDSNSRLYGTCLSNEQLGRAKLEEMKRFVDRINPGFMYIHDIDAGGWLSTRETWKQRCGECRKRWPNDDLSDADGQAGALAAWYGQVRRELSVLPSSGDYSPARDLVLIFTSPGYTHYNERGPANVWELEREYFTSLSRLIGPEPGLEFGLREQFYDSGNRKKISGLRTALDRVGHGHGIHVIAFGGGDNYISDDPTNISGAMAHFYDGAESVCLSNGAMHEEPVQMLNAEFLWNGSAGGYRENPANETQAEAVFKTIAAGTHKPPEIFAGGGFFDRMCVRQWGPEAGRLMSRALQTRHHGQWPVSHVWWSITKTVTALQNDEPCSLMNWMGKWTDRELATASALEYARRAAGISDDEDIHWLAGCLEIGKRYAEAVRLLVLLKSGRDKNAGLRLGRVIKDLEAHIRRNFIMEKTDILGGDPGCWLETIAEMKRLAKESRKRQRSGTVFSDFLVDWQVSRPRPSADRLNVLCYPRDKKSLDFHERSFPAAFCDVHQDFSVCGSDDEVIYFLNRVDYAEPMDLELRLGYDGPVKAWIDGREVFHDPNGTNPGRADAAIIPWKAAPGKHEIIVALGSNHGRAYGIFARFRRQVAARRGKGKR